LNDFDWSFVGGDDEDWENDGEEAAGDDKVLRPGGEEAEGEAEADEVRPVGLEELEPLVQRPAHLHPLVLETVQAVQQTHVHQIHQLRSRQRQHRKHKTLHKVI